MVALLAIPVVLFVAPALAGHPAIVSDNLLQNYPLRVLSARELMAGHWPVWDPYSFSGTPLLAGMNAGALYPGTLLFCVLPPLVAWIANVIVVYWVAATGLYALARWLGFAPLAAGIAALAYAYMGDMVGQLVHIGVVQGQSLLPWLVLVLLVLSRRLQPLTRESRLVDALTAAIGPVLCLGAIVGLTGLTGEPRSISDVEIVLCLVAACELVWHGSAPKATWRGRAAYLVATGVGTAVGVAVAAVQLLPGYSYIALSERAAVSQNFFGTGSLPWRWLALFAVPGALGDNGVLGTSHFFANYNLPEVTMYASLLGLCAVAAYAAQLFARSAPRRRALAPFGVLVVAGIVLTLGTTTPLGGLLHAVPLLGKTRLQNRNAALVDLGAAALLAWFLDAVAHGRAEEASLTGRRRLATTAPVALALGLAVFGVVSPATLAQRLATDGTDVATAGGARPTIALSLLIAAALLVALWRRGSPARRTRWLVWCFAADLVCFSAFFQTGLISGLPSPYPDSAAAAATFGTSGRFAVVDPLVLAYHPDARLGFGNLDVFTGLSSVQGYGSLVSARYVDATGIRYIGTIGGCQLGRGALVPLRLAAMAVAPNGLLGAPRHPPACAGEPATDVRRYFGGAVGVDGLDYVGPGLAALAAGASVTLLDRDGSQGATVGLRPSGHDTLVARFAGAPVAAGAILELPSPGVVDHAELLRARGGSVALDQDLQLGLSKGKWRLAGVVGAESIFTTTIRPQVWFAPDVRGDRARVVGSDLEGDLVVAVTARSAATLVRSEAWLPGWVATATLGTGATAALPVRPDGLVQAVTIPAGTTKVLFHYDAPYLGDGVLASLLGLVAMAAGLAAWWWLRRRRLAT